VWSDRESELDYLNVQHLVAAVEAIVTTDHLLPVTVGVFGDWGSGKSTVMRLARERLERDETVLCVHFNGWLFEGYEDAKAAILGTILDKLADERGAKAKAGALFNSLVQKVNWLRLAGWGGKALMLAHGVPPIDLALLSGFVQKAPEIAEDVVQKAPGGEDNVRRTIRDFEKDFRELLEKTGVRSVVVFVDDLDRCLPTTIIETLEAIRLFVFVPGMAFVIAADERLVRRAVQQHFPGVETATEVAPNYPSRDVGREYLEKLIQVPVHVPPLSRAEIATYVNMLFAQPHLNADDFASFCERVRDGLAVAVGNDVVFALGNAEALLGRKVDGQLAEDLALAAQLGDVLAASVHGNPRQTKRFLNALTLRLRMAESRGVTLERRITAKLMLLEYFQPALFLALARWQSTQGGQPEQIVLLEEWLRREDAPGEAANLVEPRAETAALPGESEPGARRTRGTRAATTKAKTVADAIETPAEGPRPGGADMPAELHPWMFEEWVRSWLRLDPPLGGVSLAPYFFFARERTGPMGQLVRGLSEEATRVVSQLLASAEASQRAGARAAQKLSAPEAGDVFSALLRQATTREGMEQANSPVAALMRLTAERPELQGQLLAFASSLPLGSVGHWAPLELLSAVRDPEHTAALGAILEKWKQAGGALGKAVAMAERRLQQPA
jgi:hypothetical protein